MDNEKSRLFGQDRRSSTSRPLNDEEKRKAFAGIKEKHPEADWDAFLIATKDIVVTDIGETAVVTEEAVTLPAVIDHSQDWKKKGRNIVFIDPAKGKVGEKVKLPDGTVYVKDDRGRLRRV